MTTPSAPSTSRGRARALAAALLLLGLLAPAQAMAQEGSGGRRDGSNLSLRGSLGMTASPETFNMTLEVPWAADELVSAGPLVQLGFSDDHVLFASTIQAYLTPRLDGSLEDWRPYAHMGMGLIYLKDDHRRFNRDKEDVDFLFTVGTGVEYTVAENFYMGTGFLFDVIPTGVVGNKFIFGWQVLTFRTEF